MTRTFKTLAGLFAVCLLAAGCSSQAPDRAEPSDPAGDQLAAQVASYDLAVGRQRFMVGLFSRDAGLVGGGSVDMKFAFLGTAEEQTSGQVVSEAKARFLPIPAEAGGAAPEVPDQPTLLAGTRANGVYAAEASFD